MYQRPSAPRTIGGVVDDSIRLYRASFRLWWLPSVLFAAMGLAVGFYVLTKVGVRTTPQDVFAPFRVRSVLLLYLVTTIIQIYLYLVIFAGMNAVASGTAASVTGGFTDAARAMPAAILATILFTLASSVGVLLLVIPGLYVFGRLQYWPVALMLDRAGGLESLAASWRVTKGHWWRTMTILTVLLIMLLALWFFVSFVAGLLLTLGRLDVVSSVLAMDAAVNLMYVFILPAFPAAFVATYFDLKLRREGGDLEARARELNPA